jgi:hypothetical protein
MRPEQAQVAVDGGEHAVDADVTLGQHRVEYTVHPHRRGQGSLIRRHMAAGAQQVAMRPQHLSFLRPQHHVTMNAVEK